MNFFLKYTKPSHRSKKLLVTIFLLALLPIFSLFSSCKKKLDYFSYVSEIRSNILLAETENFSLRIFIGEREVPYSADGVARESSPRFDAYLVAPNGTKTCEFFFKIGNESYGGEMSYDNVKGEYYYFCTLNVPELKTVSCEILYGEEQVILEATSVLSEKTLSPREALSHLLTTEKETFSTLTDQYGFAGEIGIRLIYEDNPYYYVGVIDRKGNVSAFLLNAETGKLLAKRRS